MPPFSPDLTEMSKERQAVIQQQQRHHFQQIQKPRKYIRRKQEEGLFFRREPSYPRLISKEASGSLVEQRSGPKDPGRNIRSIQALLQPRRQIKRRKFAEKPEEAGAALSKSQLPLQPSRCHAPLCCLLPLEGLSPGESDSTLSCPAQSTRQRSPRHTRSPGPLKPEVPSPYSWGCPQ